MLNRGGQPRQDTGLAPDHWLEIGEVGLDGRRYTLAVVQLRIFNFEASPVLASSRRDEPYSVANRLIIE